MSRGWSNTEGILAASCVNPDWGNAINTFRSIQNEDFPDFLEAFLDENYIFHKNLTLVHFLQLIFQKFVTEGAVINKISSKYNTVKPLI